MMRAAKREEILEDYRCYLQYVKSFSPASIKAYLADLRGWLNHCGIEDGQSIIPACTLVAARNWLAHLRSSGQSPTTIGRAESVQGRDRRHEQRLPTTSSVTQWSDTRVASTKDTPSGLLPEGIGDTKGRDERA